MSVTKPRRINEFMQRRHSLEVRDGVWIGILIVLEPGDEFRNIIILSIRFVGIWWTHFVEFMEVILWIDHLRITCAQRRGNL